MSSVSRRWKFHDADNETIKYIRLIWCCAHLSIIEKNNLLHDNVYIGHINLNESVRLNKLQGNYPNLSLKVLAIWDASLFFRSSLSITQIIEINVVTHVSVRVCIYMSVIPPRHGLGNHSAFSTRRYKTHLKNRHAK